MARMWLLIPLVFLVSCTASARKAPVFQVDAGNVVEQQCSGSFGTEATCIVSTDRAYSFTIRAGVSIKLKIITLTKGAYAA